MGQLHIVTGRRVTDDEYICTQVNEIDNDEKQIGAAHSCPTTPNGTEPVHIPTYSALSGFIDTAVDPHQKK